MKEKISKLGLVELAVRDGLLICIRDYSVCDNYLYSAIIESVCGTERDVIVSALR